MFMPRLAAAVLALGGVACASQEPPSTSLSARPDVQTQAAERGRRLAAGTCVSCHAIGPVDASPVAAATPFRELVHRYPLDQLEEAFAEGLVTGHPAMPAFVFRASEIDDLIAYLETVKAGQ